MFIQDIEADVSKVNETKALNIISYSPKTNENVGRDKSLHNYMLDRKYIMARHTVQGLYSLRRRSLTGIGITMINLRRSDDRLMFIMGIPILIRRNLLSE